MVDVSLHRSHAAHLADELAVPFAQAPGGLGRETPELAVVEQSRGGAALNTLPLSSSGTSFELQARSRNAPKAWQLRCDKFFGFSARQVIMKLEIPRCD